MRLIQTVSELREWNFANRPTRRALVPTMGALHAGHLSLCHKAREAAGRDGHVVATIFVNPTQFGPNEDLDAYPRQLERDLEACEANGVDLVFAPEPDEIYFPDASIGVSEKMLSRGLCGASRPGHFDGVCLVVTKLFNLTEPDVAVFGEKDYQQLAVIRRLVRDLNFPIEIIGGATVREADGLAMSSRNLYLSDEERKQAPLIQQSLREVRDLIGEGALSTAKEISEAFREKINRADLAEIDYFEVVHPETLEPLEQVGDEGFRLIAAVFFGRTRLIDNIGP